MNGFDDKMIIEFFETLYSHCPSGYLMLKPFPFRNPSIDMKFIAPDLNRQFFLDVSNGFETVSKLICDEVDISIDTYQWQFCKPLFKYPSTRPAEVVSNPCLWADSDHEDWILKDRLSKVPPPTIKLFTSPLGCHLYWVLRVPATIADHYRLVSLQIRLAHLLGGDLERVDFVGPSRIPGLFNYSYRPPHFAGCEILGHEYNFSDFDYLPDLEWHEKISVHRLLKSSPYQLLWFNYRSFLNGGELWYDPCKGFVEPEKVPSTGQ
jgi:hypothetical protein